MLTQLNAPFALPAILPHGAVSQSASTSVLDLDGLSVDEAGAVVMEAIETDLYVYIYISCCRTNQQPTRRAESHHRR